MQRLIKSLKSFTLVEACVATAISGIALAGLFTVNAHHLQLVKRTKDTNSASLVLQERIESMRICNWHQLTDVNFITTGLLSKSTHNGTLLNNLTETISIKAYPDENVCNPISIQRDSNGICIVSKTGTDLPNQRIVRVEISADWYGVNNQQKHRSTATLISNSGVSRLNLGTVTSSSTPPPSSTPVLTSTPTPTASTDTFNSDPYSYTNPPTPTNNGNSNPKGNTGGKNGKN